MKKNIAIMVPMLVSGGSERMASRLSRLLEEYFNVTFIVFDSSVMAYDVSGELIDFKLPAGGNFFSRIFILIKRIIRLRKTIRTRKIDAVISFVQAADNCLAFSLANCKKVVSCRGFEFLKKHVWLFSVFARLGCYILFNSKQMKNWFLAHDKRMAEKAVCIYNLFDIDNIIEMSNNKIDDYNQELFLREHKVIITVSWFSKAKGQWNLLKAFEILKKQVPDAGLAFVGHGGELEAQIKEMASRSRFSEDILFLGFQRNPFRYVKRASVYALSSMNEGFPNALVEAMACGVPVVAAHCETGPGEILSDEPGFQPGFQCTEPVLADYGILTPAFKTTMDFDPLKAQEEHYRYAEALEKILESDALAESYGEKASRRGAQFGEKRLVTEYVDFINKIVRENYAR